MRYVVSLLSVFTLAACITDAEPDVETADLEQSLTLSPTPLDYRPGFTTSSQLRPPDRVSHFQLVLVPRSRTSGAYAWGVSGSRVLWVYRVAEADTLSFVGLFHKAWGEVMGPGLGDGGGGVTKVPPPPTPPPVPIGEPPWSSPYVTRVIDLGYQEQYLGDQISQQLYSGQY